MPEPPFVSDSSWTKHPSYPTGPLVVSNPNRVRSSDADAGYYTPSGLLLRNLTPEQQRIMRGRPSLETQVELLTAAVELLTAALHAIGGPQTVEEALAGVVPKKMGPRYGREVVPVYCLIGAADVRKMCATARVKAQKGKKRQPISRDTLLSWRKTRGFPEPIRDLGPQGEVWDRRAVRAWLDKQKRGEVS